MKNLKDKLVSESETAAWNVTADQLMMVFGALHCLKNHKHSEAILKECGADEDTLDELIEDITAEINNDKECEAIIKQCI